MALLCRRWYSPVALRYVLLVVGILAVAVTILVARAAPATVPAGDLAVAESYTIDAASARLLVGPYSRFQWHHPGPLPFYGLAPFYALSGSKTAGLSAGALAINLLALALIFWTVQHQAQAELAIAVGVASAAYVARVPTLLISAWNPHVLVLPMMGLVVLAAAVANGSVWLLPIGALLASFVVQCHVAVGPAALVLPVSALILATRSISPSQRVTALTRPLAVTLVVVALAWCLPLIEQLKGRPGNFSELWKYFVETRHVGQPIRLAARAWGYMSSGVLRPGFSLAYGDVLPRMRSDWPLWVALSQLLLIALLPRDRRNGGFAHSLSMMLVLTALVAFWSITRIDEPVTDHEVFWISGLGALTVAAAIDVLVRLGSGKASSRPGPIVGAAILAVLYTVCAGRALTELRSTAGGNVPPDDAAAMAKAAAAIHKYVQDERVERPLVVIDQETWSFAAGVLLQLKKMGDRFAVEREWLPMFTGDVVPDGREPAAITIGGRERHFRLSSRAGNVVIGEYPPIYLDAINSVPSGTLTR